MLRLRGESVKQFTFVVVTHCIRILLSILNKKKKTGITALNAEIRGADIRSGVLVWNEWIVFFLDFTQDLQILIHIICLPHTNPTMLNRMKTLSLVSLRNTIYAYTMFYNLPLLQMHSNWVFFFTLSFIDLALFFVCFLFLRLFCFFCTDNQ